MIYNDSWLLCSVISTDGICAWWWHSVVQYYVRQKWRNLKAPAKSYPADFARNGMSQLEPFPLLLWDFSTFVQQSAGNPDRDILHESRRSKWRRRIAALPRKKAHTKNNSRSMTTARQSWNIIVSRVGFLCKATQPIKLYIVKTHCCVFTQVERPCLTGALMFGFLILEASCRAYPVSVFSSAPCAVGSSLRYVFIIEYISKKVK